LDLLISEQKEPRTPLPLSSPGGNRGTGWCWWTLLPPADAQF